MKRPRSRRLLVVSALLVALPAAVRFALAEPPAVTLHPMPAAPETEAPAAPAEKPVLLGSIQRAQVEAAVPDWVQVEAGSAPDPKAAQALAKVPAGASVTIFLGTWCGDSRRELSRFWRALDGVGGPVPFTISYVGVDYAKKEPAALVQPVDLRYVPTFIVRRDGREVGRIVESAPHGIERDLLSLLDGSAHGLLTERTDLGPAASPAPAAPPQPHP
jgi:hypothetical protein